MSAPFSLPVGPPWGMGQGGNPVMVPPSSLGPGGRPMVSSLSMQIPLPEVFPIPSAHEFNPLGSVNSAAVSANPIEIVGGQGTTLLNVPDGNIGIIRGVNLYITDMLTTTNVVWSVTVEGASPQGFDRISIFPRVAPFVSNSFDAAIRFTGPARIVMTFQNLDGGTYVIGGSYSGWYWPTAADAQWRRFGT